MALTPSHPQSIDLTSARADISKLISNLADRDIHLGQFLAWSVGRVFLNAARHGEDWQSQWNDEAMRHIKDWLKAAMVNDETWLKNIDDQGRPKKLLKFSTLEDITKEADKAMLKAAQRHSAVKLVEGDEVLHADLGDGYYLVRLLTPAALDRESAAMQHCIGDGAYDDWLDDDSYLYLSLRDPQGRPHATLEIENNKIVQFKGKQNKPPIKWYVDVLVPYLRNSEFSVDIPIYYLGYIIDVLGDWHPIDNLPEGLTVDDSLDLRGTEIKSLPRDLTVNGSILLDGSKIEFLSEGLNVTRSLYGRNSLIRSLPEDVRVGHTLDISNTKIAALPQRLKRIRNLYIAGTGITSLPEGLVVEESLDISQTAIEELPKKLTVGKHLYLIDTKINSLPDCLTVGGTINIRGSKITSIPENVKGNPIIDNVCTARNFRKMHMTEKVAEPSWTR